MRIVIDMQGAQTESRFRGIGRYTLSFVMSVVRNRCEHEVILVLNGLFPESIERIREAFEGLLPQENILVWYAPGPVKVKEAGNDTKREIAELIRETFIASLNPDIVHVTSLFEGYVDDAITSIDRFDYGALVSVSLYDLIPLLNPDQYLQSNLSYKAYYLQKIEWLKKASLFLAISDFAKQEALLSLSLNENTVVPVSTAIEKHFTKQNITTENASSLLHRLQIESSFVLYTGGADERKNLFSLIEAYSMLPVEIRGKHQLVFAGKMCEGDVARLKSFAKKYGLKPKELVFTGFISDEGLIFLYNLCKLYVFPTWHEGFGLPALEAMACGAVVIGSNTTSLPEVIGLQEALFDPFDVLSINHKIQTALTDDLFRHRFIKHAKDHIKKFSWDMTAKKSIDAWESIVDQGSRKQRSVNSESLAGWSDVLKFLNKKYLRLFDEVVRLIKSNVSLPESYIRHLASCIAQNEYDVKDFYRRKPSTSSMKWRIEGPFDSSYSLALVNRETARALSRLGYQVQLHSTDGPGDFEPSYQYLVENLDLNEMHQGSRALDSEEVDVISRFIYPPRVLDMTGRLNFLHGYCWEETGFPMEWVENFNHSLQGIIVASSHVKKILIDNGVSVPISVAGLGLDHWNRIVPRYQESLQVGGFKFLHVSSCFPRKGADRMLEAYGRAFSSHDDVTLIIKTFENQHNEIHHWLTGAKEKFNDYPDVVILEVDYTECELKGLYEQCDALIAPSRAEGFGLPMGEAMLSGLSVITTNWSGQVDFCTLETSWLVDYQFDRAKTHFNLFNSVWANPEIDSLANVMRDVFEATNDERQKRIKAGQKKLLTDYTWNRVAEKMVKAVTKMSGLPARPSLNIGWISTWNSKCGIATYSEHLIKNMDCDKPVTIFAPKDQDLVFEDTQNVERNWSIGKESNDLARIKKTIDDAAINTIIIQFNYGFFNHRELAGFIEECFESKLQIIVVLHSTVEPEDKAPSWNFELKYLKQAFMMCRRILVHSVSDLNRLKILGLVDNVAIFPHGVLDYEPHQVETIASEIPTVASYGFCLPHKGLPELIEAAYILKKRGTPIRLKLINAEYPVPESASLIKFMKQQINKYSLQELVELNNGFLDDYESLNILSKADLLVFAYQKTGESASGAVRYGVASKRPVMVTPLSIFDDLADSVFKCEGVSPPDIAEGIIKTLNSIADNTFYAEHTLKQADAWRETNNYRNVSKRLKNICLGLLVNSY